MPDLFHITTRADWERAEGIGDYHASSLATDGFIHCSWAHQVASTANRFYAGQDDLVLLVLDPVRLTAPVRDEDLYGHGAFPHVYGPFNRDAVGAVLPFAPNENGVFEWPAEAEAAT